MEYVIALDLATNTFNISDYKTICYRLRRLLRLSHHYNSIFGVITYLLPLLEEKHNISLWKEVYDKGIQWHSTLVRALIRSLSRTPSAHALNIATNLASSPDSQIRSELLKYAEEIEITHPSKSLLLWSVLIGDPVSSIRNIAIKRLVRLYYMGHLSARDAIVAATQHKNPTIRGAAYYSLSQFKDVYEDLLSAYITELNGYVREAIVYTLAMNWKNQNNKDSVKKIISLALKDPVVEVRLQTVKAIAIIRDRTMFSILAEARDDEPAGYIRRDMSIIIEGAIKEWGDAEQN